MTPCWVIWSAAPLTPGCGAAHRVKVTDGTSFSMQDTAANQKRWPQHRLQKKGCGFPVAKMLGVFCLSTGAWLGHALSKWSSHDLSLWHRISHLLLKGDVLLGDAGFCAYALMAELKGRGVDSVMRLHQARSKDMRRGTWLAMTTGCKHGPDLRNLLPKARGPQKRCQTHSTRYGRRLSRGLGPC